MALNITSRSKEKNLEKVFYLIPARSQINSVNRYQFPTPSKPQLPIMKVPFLALAAFLAITAYGDLLDPLPESASKKELRFQPLMDFDHDGCYATAAIGREGKMNPGLTHIEASVSHDCRDGRLQFSNAYSRKRCNHGYCAIMYEYYFEKDLASAFTGHRHQFENVVVFTKGNKIVRVAATERGNVGTSSTII